ncbi:DUF1330 domain-containing protein [Nioella halotolerans]|uniref:DUF1330 domain-containing protein n=1 Tax=Nioella halotolerans TaxID=2303578 RepID=UPI003F65C0ED
MTERGGRAFGLPVPRTRPETLPDTIIRGQIAMPKGYIIGHITVTDPDAYPEYIRRDTPILERLGARFLVRGGRSEVAEGSSHERHVVIEFPSYDAAKAAYNDPEYQEVAEIRRASADSVIILVEGHDE